MTGTTKNKLSVTTPSDLELGMERTFNAPRDLVWKAFTDPELIPQWWGMRNTTTVVDQFDLRPGGKWRFVNTDSEGTVHAFRGEFREITPPSHLVWTFEYEPWEGHISVETSTFEEHDGKTTVKSMVVFDTVEDRNEMLGGAEAGAAEMYDRLEELLVTLA